MWALNLCKAASIVLQGFVIGEKKKNGEKICRNNEFQRWLAYLESTLILTRPRGKPVLLFFVCFVLQYMFPATFKGIWNLIRFLEWSTDAKCSLSMSASSSSSCLSALRRQGKKMRKGGRQAPYRTRTPPSQN